MKLRTGLVSVMSCGMRIPPEPQTVTAMSMVPPRRHASDPRRRSSDTTPSLHAWLMQFASVTPADAHDFPSEHPQQNSPPIASPPQSMSVSGAVLDAIVATRRGTEIEDTIQGHAEPTRLGPTSANTSITIGTRMRATDSSRVPPLLAEMGQRVAKRRAGDLHHTLERFVHLEDEQERARNRQRRDTQDRDDRGVPRGEEAEAREEGGEPEHQDHEQRGLDCVPGLLPEHQPAGLQHVAGDLHRSRLKCTLLVVPRREGPDLVLDALHRGSRLRGVRPPGRAVLRPGRGELVLDRMADLIADALGLRSVVRERP